MSNNIIIFDIEYTPEDYLTKNSQEQLYENLKKNPNIHFNSIDLFYEMELLNELLKYTDSTIDSILLQNIISYTTPIIEYIPETEIKKIRIEKTIQTKKEKIQEKQQKEKESDFLLSSRGIKIKLDTDTKCLFNNDTIIIPKNHIISVIGIKINNRFLKNVFLSIHHYFYENSKLDLYLSANFSVFDYLLNQYNIDDALTNRYNTIIFKDEQAAKTILKEIKNIIISIELLREKNTLYLNNKVYNNVKKTINKIPYIKERPILIKPISKELKNLNALTELDLSYENKNNTIMALINAGLYDYYNKLNINSLSKDVFEKLKSLLEIRNLKEEQTYEKFKMQIQIFHKKNIALKEFGISDLFKLSQRQLTIVNKKYNSIKTSAANLEPAHNLYKALDADDNEKIKTALMELKKVITYNEEKIEPQYFKDKNNNNIICSHVIFIAHLKQKKYKDIIEKSEKIKNITLSKFSETDITDGYFCKNCGEKLYEMNNYEITDTSSFDYSSARNNNYDEMYSYIYKEVVYVLSNYIEFINNQAFINIMEIVYNITSIISPEIKTIESNLLKVKTTTKESLAPTIAVYTYIYIMAAITQLIYTNDFIQFKASTGGRTPAIEPPAKILKTKAENTKANVKELQNIINTALSIVKKVKYIDIQKSEFITNDNIKSLFLKAYRWVININYISVKHNRANYFIQNNIINYFIYAYNFIANEKITPIYSYNLNTLLSIPEKSFRGIKNILGRDYDEIDKNIQKNISIFSSLVKPGPWSKDTYKTESLLQLYEYITKELFMLTPDEPALEEFYKSYNHIAIEEDKRKRTFKLSRVVPYNTIKQNFIKTPIDKNFKNCKCKNFDVYVYKKIKNGAITSEKQELTLKDIQGWIEKKEYSKLENFKNFVLVDEICKRCHIKKNKDIEVFYNYFENICPKGELHNFIEEKCTKCGITPKAITDLDATYYNKYKSIYEKLKTEEKQALDIALQPKKPRIIKTEKTTWRISNEKSLEFSKKFKVNYNTILNIGLYEKQELKNINNIIQIEKTKHDIIKRNNALYDYYLYIVRNYYLLKNSEFIYNIPNNLIEFLKKYSNIDINKKLKNINEDWINKYKALKKSLQPDELTNFLLESICDTLLEIYKNFKDTKMGADFVNMLFSYIIEAERKLTNFIVMNYRKSTIDELNETNDQDREKEINTEDYDISPDIEREEQIDEEIIEDEEPDDLFSLENIDIADEDMDEDNLFTDAADRD